MAQAGVKGYGSSHHLGQGLAAQGLELVAAMVSQIGITYKIKNMDMGGFNNLWLNKRFEQNLEDITLVAPTPTRPRGGSCTARGRSACYNNAQMDLMLDGARSDSTRPARTIYKIVDTTLEDCP